MGELNLGKIKEAIDYGLELEKELGKKGIINSIGFKNLLDIINESEFKKRKEKWEKLKNNSEVSPHPYYLGFGNPSSEILFIGKEQAFNPNSQDDAERDLLFDESINNLNHWKSIVDGKLDRMEGNDIDEKINNFAQKYGFCPLFPLSNGRYNHKSLEKTFKGVHTWKFYEKLINECYGSGKDYNYDENTNSYTNSFFSKCFMTELNFNPSRKTGKFDYYEWEELRMPFLSNSFFKSFKVVVFTAKSYIKGYENDVIENIFNAREETKDITIGNKKVDIYKSEKQTIILTHQLSGSAGWSNKSVEKLGELISTSLKKL